MKFKVNRKEFYQALQSIIGVVPLKTTVPILSDILLDLENNQLTLTGTDLEVSISTKITVQGEVSGAVAIPAKVLYEIVRELPDIPMELQVDEENKVTLSTEKGLYRIAGEPHDDFPKISMEKTLGYFTISGERLARMIEKTIFAVSADELRTTLMGVLLQITESDLRMVSTDGHRLVKIVNTDFHSPDFQIETIVPTKALNLMLKNNPDREDVKVEIGDDHIVFNLNNTTIFSKSIEGQFPNYERVIPVDNDRNLVVNKELLSSSVRRVAIFSNSITHQIRFSISANLVKIQSEDIEFGGEAREEIVAEYQGDDVEIGYNANYVLDVLRHLDSDEVIFKLKDSTSAGIITPVLQKENEEVLMLLMPIRLNDE
ncbi:MAG: DNA polymerase III subunit beta [bacterium]